MLFEDGLFLDCRTGSMAARSSCWRWLRMRAARSPSILAMSCAWPRVRA
jgi:hypothetical protein